MVNIRPVCGNLVFVCHIPTYPFCKVIIYKIQRETTPSRNFVRRRGKWVQVLVKGVGDGVERQRGTAHVIHPSSHAPSILRKTRTALHTPHTVSFPPIIHDRALDATVDVLKYYKAALPSMRYSPIIPSIQRPSLLYSILSLSTSVTAEH